MIDTHNSLYDIDLKQRPGALLDLERLEDNCYQDRAMKLKSTPIPSSGNKILKDYIIRYFI